jgi:hypothetical protein
VSPVKREGGRPPKESREIDAQPFVRFIDDGKINGRLGKVIIFRLAAVSGVPH